MFRSALLALAIVGAALPAAAERSLSITLTPRNAAEADLMRLGIGLYALHQQIEGAGGVRQIGEGNMAALLQSGPGQFAVIDQRGQGHQGQITQTGQGNAWALFQRGRDTSAAITQSGRNGVGITFVQGW